MGLCYLKFYPLGLYFTVHLWQFLPSYSPALVEQKNWDLCLSVCIGELVCTHNMSLIPCALASLVGSRTVLSRPLGAA